MIEHLDAISRQMWNNRFDGPAFDMLRQKVYVPYKEKLENS
jgi:hypothetical protein